MSFNVRATNTASIICLACLLGCWAANCCQAQEMRRYRPNSPTVSPYVNLDRFNTSGLPNYYSLVRPFNNQRQINLQTQRLQRQQASTIERIEQQQAAPEAVTGTGSRFLTSGSRAGYQNTLQFYPAIVLRR